MKNDTCPVCGSANLQKTLLTKTIIEPFGGQKDLQIVNCICNACKSYGDFFNENEKLLQTELSKLKKSAIANILSDFSQSKISLSAIERALDIPQRTLLKWKSGASNPSSIGIALLRFLRLFPWLIEVAENNFDYSESQRIHMKNAFTDLIENLAFDKKGVQNVGDIA